MWVLQLINLILKFSQNFQYTFNRMTLSNETQSKNKFQVIIENGNNNI